MPRGAATSPSVPWGLLPKGRAVQTGVAPGTIVDGRYRVLRFLNQGGAGVVHEVEPHSVRHGAGADGHAHLVDECRRRGPSRGVEPGDLLDPDGVGTHPRQVIRRPSRRVRTVTPSS